MIVPKPYRIKGVLVTLIVVIGCVWLITSVDDPQTRQPEVSPSTRSEGAMPSNELSEIAPEIGDDHAPPGDRHFVAAGSERPVGRIVGRVVDNEGMGLAGIEVSLRTLRRANRGFFLRRAMTGSGGEFMLHDIDPEAVYVLFTGAMLTAPSVTDSCGFAPARARADRTRSRGLWPRRVQRTT